MLYHFFINRFSSNVTDLEAFCDGCAGQNKNFTIICFFHTMIYTYKRFKTVKLTFPIRGHSYMECDRDTGLVNQKADVELPENWCRVLEEARAKPTPYNVIHFSRSQFLSFTDHMKLNFKATFLFPTRPVQEIRFEAQHPKLVSYRNNWNGSMKNVVLAKPQKKGSILRNLPVPMQLYPTDLAISKEKYKDLQVLKRFCRPENHAFFDNVSTSATDITDGSEGSSSDTF